MLTLTAWENYSITAGVARAMAELNQPEKAKYLILTAPTARIAGAVVIPLAAIGDVFAHVLLATGKVATGIIISPYNTFAVAFFPDSAAPIDLEFSSALVHLTRVIQSLFDGAVLPFICLLNPARAHQYMQHRLLEVSKKDLSRPLLARKLNELNDAALKKAQIEDLKRRIEAEERRLATVLPQTTPVSAPTSPLPIRGPRSIDMATPMKRVDQHRLAQTPLIPTPAREKPQAQAQAEVFIPPLPPEKPQVQAQTQGVIPPPPPGKPPVALETIPSTEGRSLLFKNIQKPSVRLKKTVKLSVKDESIIKDKSLVYLVLETLPKVKEILGQIESELKDHTEEEKFFAFTKTCVIDSSDDEWDDSDDESPMPQPLPKFENAIELSMESDVFDLLKNAINDKVIFSHAEFLDLREYYVSFKKEIENQIKLKSKNPGNLTLVDNAILMSHGTSQGGWSGKLEKTLSEIQG